MKHSLLILFGVFCFSTGFTQNESQRQTISELQQRLNKYVENNDVDQLGKLMHAQFYVHTPGGPYIPKDSLLLGFKTGGNPYKVFQPKEEHFTLLDKNTIVTSGKEVFMHRSGKYADKEHHREFYHIWKRTKGEWLIAGRFVAMVD